MQRITKDKRAARCGRSKIGPALLMDGGGDGSHVAGVMLCGLSWSCPVCAPKIAAERAADVETILGGHIVPEGAEPAPRSAWHQTLTVPHDWGAPLGRLGRLVREAFRKLISGRGWQRLRRVYRVGGFVRAFEATHGRNGWHPHIHVLWLLDRELTPRQAAAFRARLVAKWEAAVEAAATLAGAGGARSVRTVRARCERAAWRLWHAEHDDAAAAVDADAWREKIRAATTGARLELAGAERRGDAEAAGWARGHLATLAARLDAGAPGARGRRTLRSLVRSARAAIRALPDRADADAPAGHPARLAFEHFAAFRAPAAEQQPLERVTSRQVGRYVAKFGAAVELTQWADKRGKRRGRNAFEILRELRTNRREIARLTAAGGELVPEATRELRRQVRRDVRLWREWERGAKGAKAITYSVGLRARFGLGAELDGPALVAADAARQAAAAAAVVEFTRQGFTLLQREHATGLLDLCEVLELDGRAGVAAWMEGHGFPPFRLSPVGEPGHEALGPDGAPLVDADGAVSYLVPLWRFVAPAAGRVAAERTAAEWAALWARPPEAAEMAESAHRADVEREQRKRARLGLWADVGELDDGASRAAARAYAG